MTQLAVITDEAEARALTDRTKESMSQTWELLHECWVREAWRPLGYTSWRRYALAEFDMGTQYLYRLLDHGKFMAALEEAAGSVSPIGDIPEGRTRDLHDQLPEITEAIGSGLPVKDALENALENVRHEPVSMAQTPLELGQDYVQRAGAFLGYSAQYLSTERQVADAVSRCDRLVRTTLRAIPQLAESEIVKPVQEALERYEVGE